MPISNQEILAEIEKNLQSLEAQGLGHELIASLQPILATNLKRGRIQNFIEHDIDRVSEYVQKVVDVYQRLNPLVHALKFGRTDESWESLFSKMQLWAYNLFVRKNFYPGDHTRDIAAECATEAAIIVLNAHFPYDTDLSPWLYTIVAHTCQKYMRKGTSAMEKSVVDLDEQLVLKDSAIEELEYQIDMNTELATALAKLSKPRRQSIELSYFSELPPDEIAKKMNKSIGAIYSLRFNALDDLRTIMGQSMDDTHE